MMRKEKPIFNKIASVVVILCSALIIVLAMLQLLGVWENAAYAYMPLMGVNLLVNTVTNWKANRWIAIVNLIGALIVLLFIILVVFVK